MCNFDSEDPKKQHATPISPNCSPQVGYISATAKHMFSLIQSFSFKVTWANFLVVCGPKEKNMERSAFCTICFWEIKSINTGWASMQWALSRVLGSCWSRKGKPSQKGSVLKRFKIMMGEHGKGEALFEGTLSGSSGTTRPHLLSQNVIPSSFYSMVISCSIMICL